MSLFLSKKYLRRKQSSKKKTVFVLTHYYFILYFSIDHGFNEELKDPKGQEYIYILIYT